MRRASLPSNAMAVHGLGMQGVRASLYTIRHLIARSREVSEPLVLYLEWPERSEIWQVPRQQCLSNLGEMRFLNCQWRGFENSPDRTIRRFIWYWNGAQVTSSLVIFLFRPGFFCFSNRLVAKSFRYRVYKQQEALREGRSPPHVIWGEWCNLAKLGTNSLHQHLSKCCMFHVTTILPLSARFLVIFLRERQAQTPKHTDTHLNQPTNKDDKKALAVRRR